jgi:hypothetical protein
LASFGDRRLTPAPEPTGFSLPIGPYAVFFDAVFRQLISAAEP